MQLIKKVDPNLQKLAEQYAKKYPYPEVAEWIQFGEMVLFQAKLAEKDENKGHTEPEELCAPCREMELENAWNEIRCCDDVRIDQGLAVAIADLQKLRVAAEAKCNPPLKPSGVGNPVHSHAGCPFMYCDQEAPFTACKEKCRHA